MPFYSVPMTILASVDIFAPNPATATREALRYIEGLETGEHYKDGWNSIQVADGRPIIDNVSRFDVENIDPDEVETLPCRWNVRGQRDLNAGDAARSDTHFVGCDDDAATAWSVFETRDGDTSLVDDYPSRDAAEAAVRALEAGQPLPDPDWTVTPVDIAPELAAIVERLVRADIIPDANAFAVALREAGDLLAKLGVNVDKEA